MSNSQNIPSDLLTITAAADELGKWRASVNRAVLRGTLPCVEIGGKRFVSRKSARIWAENPHQFCGRPSETV